MTVASGPLVDIIIPTRNRAELTAQAVDSVVRQSYRNWRLLVVDDGSDSTELRKLTSCLPSDSRIQLITHRTSSGAQAARETGLLRSTADLIAFLDSDDLWHPSKLERQVSLLLDKSSSSSRTLVICGYHWIAEDGSTRRTAIPTDADVFTYRNMSSPLMTRDALVSAGGVRRPDDARLPIGEHIDLFLRLFQTAQVLVVSEPLVSCRDHGGTRNSAQPPEVGAAAFAELIRRHRHFLRTEAPALDHDRSLRAGGRFLAAGQLVAALRHLAVAARFGSMSGRIGLLRTVGSITRRRAASLLHNPTMNHP